VQRLAAAERGDFRALADCGKQLSQLNPALNAARAFLRLDDELAVALADPELAALQSEIEHERAAAAQQLVCALSPHSPTPTVKTTKLLVEVRPGVGGTEAAHWAAELAELLCRYCERLGILVEQLERNEASGGGIKSQLFAVRGKQAGRLLAESGVHRVQRVSAFDRKGRIHTSAATVAVLPEPDTTEFNLDENELKWQIFRSSGKGGQNVNKLETAVRLTHLPTGLTVSMQDERKQGQNRAKALRLMTARLAERKARQLAEVRAADRRGQVGSADRSQRRRTYDFPERIAVDHRSSKRAPLDRVLAGELDLLD
jgi:peptide chain release factor 1